MQELKNIAARSMEDMLRAVTSISTSLDGSVTNIGAAMLQYQETMDRIEKAESALRDERRQCEAKLFDIIREATVNLDANAQRLGSKAGEQMHQDKPETKPGAKHVSGDEDEHDETEQPGTVITLPPGTGNKKANGDGRKAAASA